MSRLNFSSRCVITPAFYKYKIDEVVMPYLAFLELFKFHIINILQKTKDINYNDSLHIFNEATLEFNEEIYLIMKDIIDKTKGGIKILLNRKLDCGFIQ